MIIKKNYSIEYFNELMSGLQGYYDSHINDPKWKESAEDIKKIMDNVLKYSCLSVGDFNPDTGEIFRVRFTCTDEEFEIILTLLHWSIEDAKKINYSYFLIEKYNAYWKKKEDEKNKIISDYEKFISDDYVVPEGQKKTKKIFSQSFGYSYYTVLESLKDFVVK